MGFVSLAQCQEVRFQRLTTEDGLSNDSQWSAGCVLKDDFGFVWIATLDGLNRWDGYEVEVFRNNLFDTTSIHSNFVTSLAQSQDGNIWIGTADKGLSRFNYKTGVFTDMGLSSRLESVPQINFLYADSLDYVWISTAFDGLYRYHIPTDSFESMPLYKDDPALSWKDTGTVNAIKGKNGNLIFCNLFGVHAYNYNDDSFTHYTVELKSFFGMALDDDGKIWISDKSWPGIKILDLESGVMEEFDPTIKESVLSIRKDNLGRMWYSLYDNEHQLRMYDPSTKATAIYRNNSKNKFSFSPSRAVEMTFDSLGNLWYMTYQGAGYAKIEDTYFEKLTPYPVQNILFVNDTTVLLPIDNRVLSLNVNTKNVSLFYTAPKESEISPSLLDKENRFWFRHKGDGKIYIKDLKNNAIDSIYDDYHIESLSEGKNVIWSSKMLNYYSKKTLEYFSLNNLLKEKKVDTLKWGRNNDLKVLNDGIVVLASTSDGLYIYNPKDTTLTNYDGKDFKSGQLSSPSLSYIYESPSSRKVYVGTRENLNIWNRATDKFTYINHSDGLKGKILSLVEDDNQNIWVLTSQGLYQIANEKVVANYGKRFSLTSLLTRMDPIMVNKNGYIYFSTSEALYRFDPNKLSDISPPQDVVIKDVFKERQKLAPSTSEELKESVLFNPALSFDYSNRNIGFEFVSPFESDNEVDYYYRLIGFNDVWYNNKSNREAHYTNLDNGEYTFEVKAKSPAGKWTANISSITFIILPPWYKKWWAYLLFALIVGSVLYGLYRYRINQILRYERLRTKISADLHDDVGSLLSSLAMQSDVLGMDAPPEKVSKYEKFSSLSREAMDRMRDTVWAIDSRKDNVMSLVDRMADYISDMYEDHSIKVNFVHEKTNLKKALAPDIRQNIYLIFKEALNNAMKYSNGDRVEIVLKQDTKGILLCIKDNGSIAKAKTSGTGISNMKMRAKRIGGQLEIIKEDGFEVKLIVN